MMKTKERVFPLPIHQHWLGLADLFEFGLPETVDFSMAPGATSNFDFGQTRRTTNITIIEERKLLLVGYKVIDFTFLPGHVIAYSETYMDCNDGTLWINIGVHGSNEPRLQFVNSTITAFEQCIEISEDLRYRKLEDLSSIDPVVQRMKEIDLKIAMDDAFSDFWSAFCGERRLDMLEDI